MNVVHLMHERTMSTTVVVHAATHCHQKIRNWRFVSFLSDLSTFSQQQEG
jgi:hypothetical protein